jgi:hypothetical protein
VPDGAESPTNEAIRALLVVPRLRARLIRHAYARCGSVTDAQDIVQEAMKKVLGDSAIALLPPKGSLPSKRDYWQAQSTSRPDSLVDPTGQADDASTESVQNDGGGMHGSSRHGLLARHVESMWNPLAHCPASTTASQGGSAPPQHGCTQTWLAVHVSVPHATAASEGASDAASSPCPPPRQASWGTVTLQVTFPLAKRRHCARNRPLVVQYVQLAPSCVHAERSAGSGIGHAGSMVVEPQFHAEGTPQDVVTQAQHVAPYRQFAPGCVHAVSIPVGDVGDGAGCMAGQLAPGPSAAASEERAASVRSAPSAEPAASDAPSPSEPELAASWSPDPSCDPDPEPEPESLPTSVSPPGDVRQELRISPTAPTEVRTRSRCLLRMEHASVRNDRARRTRAVFFCLSGAKVCHHAEDLPIPIVTSRGWAGDLAARWVQDVGNA